MSNQTKYFNPFFLLLLICGVAFLVTATAYGMMTVKLMNPGAPVEQTESQLALVQYISDYGFSLLMIELALLMVCTFGAILTDDFWKNRAEKKTNTQ